MARPGRPERNRTVRSFRQLRRFHHDINSNKVFGTHNREFAMASGEMSRDEFTDFLKTALGIAAKVSTDGAVHFVCMDWRHVEELVTAGRSIYGAMLNLIAWVKTNAGQGSFYRSQHELIGVFGVRALPA